MLHSSIYCIFLIWIYNIVKAARLFAFRFMLISKNILLVETRKASAPEQEQSGPIQAEEKAEQEGRKSKSWNEYLKAI